MGRIWNIRTYARFVHTPENWLWYRSSPGLYTRSVVLDLVAYWRGVLMGCKVVTIRFCAWAVAWWCPWAALFLFDVYTFFFFLIRPEGGETWDALTIRYLFLFWSFHKYVCVFFKGLFSFLLILYPLSDLLEARSLRRIRINGHLPGGFGGVEMCGRCGKDVYNM